MLDFPSSPSTGQQFTGPNGVVWVFDSQKWVAGTAAGAYAPIASPAFTGNPTAPTPPAGDADTSLATTAFVAAALPVASSTTPLMDGAAAIGSGTTWAKADHVHPTDTSRAAQSSLANYLLLTGGTLSGSLGVATALSISAASGWCTINMQRTAGNANQIAGTTAGSTRWTMHLGDPAAETGGSVGSNFGISRFNDAGSPIDNPLTIARGDGIVTMPKGIRPLAMYCQPGIAGPFRGNGFNIDWTGTPQLWIDNGNVGTIAFTSDYRIKKDVVPLASTWERVKALRPISYTQQEFTPPSSTRDTAGNEHPLFLADDVERWGFIAHELQATLIESAATGVKDDPVCVQSPNPWVVLATVTRALQEAMARIEALETGA